MKLNIKIKLKFYSILFSQLFSKVNLIMEKIWILIYKMIKNILSKSKENFYFYAY